MRRALSLEGRIALKPELIPGAGSPDKLGATITAEGVNFAVYSETASALYVSIYDETDKEIGRFELDGHDDHIHHGLIANVGAGTRYGFRADGRYDPDQGYFFDPNKLLSIPMPSGSTVRSCARRAFGCRAKRRSTPRR
jgi:glycogen operon protein